MTRRPDLQRRIRLLVVVALFPTAAGCTRRSESTRSEDAAAATPPAAPTLSTGRMSEGPNLVAAFPPDGIDGYKRVFSQEKDGFAEAKLQKDGVDVATLSIASAEDAAKAQLEDAKERFGDWPMIVGSDRTIVLVKHRYQVTVASRTLDRDARGRILDRFDLERLAGGR